MRSAVAVVSHKSSSSSWWPQALHNRLIALVLAMVVIVPLVATPADRRLAGVASLMLEGFALLLLVVLLWRARWEWSRKQIFTFLRTGANLPVLLLAALATLSCITSPFKMFTIQAVLQLGAGVLLYFVVAYQFRQSKHLSMLVDTLLFLAIAVSLLGLGQYTVNPEGRATILFGNQQPLGSLLMILLPMVAVMAINEKGTNRQYVAQFATVLTAGSLLLAQTRSAWMGAAAAMLTLGVLALMSAKSKDSSKGSSTVRSGNLAAQKHKLVLPAMLVMVSIGFFALMATQNSGIVERASTLADPASQASLQGRVAHNWAGAMQMVKERPLTGWGIGLYPVYQHKYTRVGVPVSGRGDSVSLGEQAHNFYLQTAAELGFPGLLLMLAVLGSFLVSGVRRVEEMDLGIRRSLLMGSMAATVAFAVDAVSSPSWQFGQVSMFLWLILGTGVSCIRPRARQEEEAPAVAFAAPRLIRPALVVAASLFMSLVVLPTASMATHSPGHYGDHDNDGDDNNLGDLVGAGVAIAGIGGLIYWLVDQDDCDDDNSTSSTADDCERPQSPTIVPAPEEPGVIR